MFLPDAVRAEFWPSSRGQERAPAFVDTPAQVCRQVGLAPATLQGGGRTARHTAARAGIAYLWTEGLGHPGRPLAGVLGVCPAAVYKAARRGAAQAPTWQRLLGRTRQET